VSIKVSKEQGISIGYSTVLAWITIVPAVWFVSKPFVLDAVAQDLSGHIKRETKPLTDAFKVLLQRDIAELRRQITAMEYTRDQDLASWSLEEAQELNRLRLTLRGHERALEALEESETELGRLENSRSLR